MSRSPDVLVIGAGIVGAACAFELVREGLGVCLVDAAGVGGGATAEGMGHLVLLDDSPAQLALTRFSLELWHRHMAELGPSCEVSRCGTLWLAEDETQWRALEAKAAGDRRRGIDSSLVDSMALAELEPKLRPDLAGALLRPGDSVLYPPAVAAEWVERAICDHGLCWRPGTAVRRLRGGEPGRPVVAELTDGERIEAGHAVVAAGLGALDLLPEPLGGLELTARKGHLLITDRYPGFCRHQLVEAAYLASAHAPVDGDGGEGAAASVAFNLQSRPNGQLLLGSSRQNGITSREVEVAAVGQMVRRALRFVPELSGLSVIRAWAGFRAATADHLPILGPAPGRPHLLLATGHEGLGITTAPASARLVVDQLLGRESAIPADPYRADRGTNDVDSTFAPQPSALREHGSHGDEIGLLIDGEPVRVPAGVTVAAAIARDGRTAFRHSVSGSPRAPLCGMGVCGECRVTLDGRPHQLACQHLCHEGAQVETGGGVRP